MLKVAKRKSKRLMNIDFDIRGIYDLKGPDNSFDAVIASQILHLLDKPEVAVAEHGTHGGVGGRPLN